MRDSEKPVTQIDIEGHEKLQLRGGFTMEDINVNTDQTQVEGGEVEVKGTSYTETEMMALLQKETDKRVTAALSKQESKYKAKMAEADKLGQMDESQKKMYEYEQRVKDLETKESEFTLMRNKIEAQKVMASRGLPIEFTDYIVAEDADTMMERIGTFEKQFKAAVNDAVSRKIASPTPKAGSVTQGGLTKESFNKLGIAAQAELYKTNPTLYKELSQK